MKVRNETVTLQCQACGKFVKNGHAILDHDGNIKTVKGTCKTHGLVKAVGDWWYEDFVEESA